MTAKAAFSRFFRGGRRWRPGDGDADAMVGNDGATVGAIFPAGLVGQAFSFNGVGNYVSIPHDDTLNLNHFTLEAWVNPGRLPTRTYQAIMSKNVTKDPRPPSLWWF